MRPQTLLIGVTAKHGHPAWTEENTKNYVNVLCQMGVAAVVLSPDTPTVLPDGAVYQPDSEGRLPVEILERLDGLILAGGGDVHPRYFHQELNGAEPDQIDLKRDELELTLARQALAMDLPLFGICRGCQVLNVAAGGGMIQDLPGHRSPKGQVRLHAVEIQQGSRLRDLLGVHEIQVNTYHHQGVDLANLAPGFVPSGVAQPDTWLLEAFESPRHRWTIGVQWHPERLFELPSLHQRLWESFLAECQRHTH